MARLNQIIAAMQAALSGIPGLTVERATGLPVEGAKKYLAEVHNGDDTSDTWLSARGKDPVFEAKIGITGAVSAPAEDISAALADLVFRVRAALCAPDSPLWEAVGPTGAVQLTQLATDLHRDAQATGTFVQVITVKYLENLKI